MLLLICGVMASASFVTSTTASATEASSSKTPVVAAPPPTQSQPLDRDQAAVQQALERLGIWLQLELPRDCGSTAVFVQRLLARLDRIRDVDAVTRRTVQARINVKSNGTFRATMTLLDADGRSASRVVDANHCEDAIDALALITAVTLDPTGASRSEADPSANRSSSTAAAATDRNPEPGPKPASAPAAIMPPRAQPIRNASEVPPVPTRSDTRIGLGLGFVGFRGPGPGWMHGVELSTRLLRAGHSGFTPSVRLSLAYAVRRNITAIGGIADFEFFSSRLEFCPWQLVSSTTEIRGCGLAHAGLVTARGRVTLGPESHRRPFFALGAGLEAVLLAADWLGIAVQLHAEAPTARDTYAFDPAAFYRVSRIGFDITAGLETRFR